VHIFAQFNAIHHFMDINCSVFTVLRVRQLLITDSRKWTVREARGERYSPAQCVRSVIASGFSIREY